MRKDETVWKTMQLKNNKQWKEKPGVKALSVLTASCVAL